MILGETLHNAAYKTARYTTKYLNVPPNLHRLRNAVGLMGGLFVGRYSMNLLTGETPDGKKVYKENFVLPLQPLHGILAYDHFSDAPKDRWMKVFDQMVPGIIGGIGAAAGSFSFFSDPYKKMIVAKEGIAAKEFTLADSEHFALFHQSKPFATMSGASAVAGSASGFGVVPFPHPLHYSATLGSTFSLRSGRTMGVAWLRPFFNAHTGEPFRWIKLLNRGIDYAVGCPDRRPEKLVYYSEGVLKSLYPKAETKHVNALLEMIHEIRDPYLVNGVFPPEAAAEVRKKLRDTLGDKGFEETLLKIGLDPREAAPGDMGVVSYIAHKVGDFLGMKTTQRMEENWQKLRQGLEERFPELKDKPFDINAHKFKTDPAKKFIGGAFLGTGAVTLGAIALSRDTQMSDLKHHNKEPDESTLPPLDKTLHRHRVHSKRTHSIVNGKILDTAEGITGMLSAGIGSHRVHCALGLTVGSLLGDKLMEAMTGTTFLGEVIRKDKVWKPLQKLYKIIPFNPNSDHIHDKWMQILRWGVPGVLGAVAVMQGSKLFFSDRSDKMKKARYLDEVEDKATFAQAEPWSYTSAISGLFGFPSGLPLLPLTNYSTNLGTRYSMAAGRKVSLPVIGKLWSNNSTLFPFGPSGMIDMLIKEAVNNKSFDPELLETEAIGILKPWFKNVTPEQVESFVLEVHRVRDQFYRDGGVPEEMKEQLQKELKAHFKGAGLEHTLEHIGLSPLKATIAENGWSGAIANTLGAKKNVEKIKHNYQDSYRERLEKERHQPTPDSQPKLNQ